MSWVRVAWSKCTLLYVSYMLVQISFFISSTYIVFVFIDPKISTPMNQGRVPHNNLSFHRCIPPSYHNFIKWWPSTLDPVPRLGRPRNFVTMGVPAPGGGAVRAAPRGDRRGYGRRGRAIHQRPRLQMAVKGPGNRCAACSCCFYCFCCYSIIHWIWLAWAQGWFIGLPLTSVVSLIVLRNGN